MSTINIASVYTLFLNWAVANIGHTRVYLADQDGPREVRPYATLKIISGPSRVYPRDIEQPTANPGEVNVAGWRELTMAVEVYGTGGMQSCVDLEASLEIPSVYETFRAAGVAIIEVLPVVNLTELLETDFEERGQFDVRLLASSNVLVVPSPAGTGWIETTEPVEANLS